MELCIFIEMMRWFFDLFDGCAVFFVVDGSVLIEVSDGWIVEILLAEW